MGSALWTCPVSRKSSFGALRARCSRILLQQRELSAGPDLSPGVLEHPGVPGDCLQLQPRLPTQPAAVRRRRLFAATGRRARQFHPKRGRKQSGGRGTGVWPGADGRRRRQQRGLQASPPVPKWSMPATGDLDRSSANVLRGDRRIASHYARDRKLQRGLALELQLVLQAVVARQPADELKPDPVVEDAADVLACDPRHGGNVALAKSSAGSGCARRRRPARTPPTGRAKRAPPGP